MLNQFDFTDNQELFEYYKNKQFELYGHRLEKNTYDYGTYYDLADGSADLLRSEYNAVSLKWYEIMLLRTAPVQNIIKVKNASVKDYIFDIDTPVITTGVCIIQDDILRFVKGKGAYIGVDDRNNFYKVLDVRRKCVMYDGNAYHYMRCRELKNFLSENNPKLLEKIKLYENTNSIENEEQELIFEAWEYFKPLLIEDRPYSWWSAVYKLPKDIWSITEKDYNNFKYGSQAYLVLQQLVNCKKFFKEEERILYGQVYRPIRKK